MSYYPKPLRRSMHDRWFGGVCAGIAEYFGLDPTIVRVAWVLLSMFGAGILVYVIMWCVIPAQEYY